MLSISLLLFVLLALFFIAELSLFVLLSKEFRHGIVITKCNYTFQHVVLTGKYGSCNSLDRGHKWSLQTYDSVVSI